MPDLEAQWSMLVTKFRSLVTPRLGSERTDQLLAACRGAEHLKDITELLVLTTPPRD